MKIILAVALAALSIGCASTPEAPAAPGACGLPAGEGWALLQKPPGTALEALERMRAANPFHAADDPGTHSLWLRRKGREQIAHCDYSGTAECGIGSTVLFNKSGDDWKPEDDALLTICSTR